MCLGTLSRPGAAKLQDQLSARRGRRRHIHMRPICTSDVCDEKLNIGDE